MKTIDLMFDLSPLVIEGGANTAVAVPAREVHKYNNLTLVSHDVYTIGTKGNGTAMTLDKGSDVELIKRYWEIVPSKLNWRAVSIAELGHCLGVQRSDKRKDFDDMHKLVDLLLSDGIKMQELLAKRASALKWGEL